MYTYVSGFSPSVFLIETSFGCWSSSTLAQIIFTGKSYTSIAIILEGSNSAGKQTLLGVKLLLLAWCEWMWWTIVVCSPNKGRWQLADNCRLLGPPSPSCLLHPCKGRKDSKNVDLQLFYLITSPYLCYLVTIPLVTTHPHQTNQECPKLHAFRKKAAEPSELLSCQMLLSWRCRLEGLCLEGLWRTEVQTHFGCETSETVQILPLCFETFVSPPEPQNFFNSARDPDAAGALCRHSLPTKNDWKISRTANGYSATGEHDHQIPSVSFTFLRLGSRGLCVPLFETKWNTRLV